MAAYEAGESAPLQGVSQQINRARQPGQVQAQENMLSDPVTGIRRRPGAEYKYDLAVPSSSSDEVLAWFVDIGGVNMHVLLDLTSGTIKLLNSAYTVLKTLDASAYLAGATRKAVRAAVVGDELFLLNTAKIPALVSPAATLSPDSRGFFYIVAGAFNKKYEVTITSARGTISANYTTPSGAGAGDPALATSAYIANQLYTTLAASASTIGVSLSILDSYVYVRGTSVTIYTHTGATILPIPGQQYLTGVSNPTKGTVSLAGDTVTFIPESGYVGNATYDFSYYDYSTDEHATATKTFAVDGTEIVTTGVRVESSSGIIYMTVSKDSYVTVEANLPPRLPPSADGYIVRVGDTKLPKYYTYKHNSASWVESGEHGAPAGITNMPISVKYSEGDWVLSSTTFEGRLAGDNESNPTPRFVGVGITGMGAYQGRLVLLSGPQVCLSASAKPRRMYRSTVTALLDNDTIQVGSSANSSASYEYAVPFQKDLLLFSAKYQALLPAGTTAVTPRTAMILVTSTFSADMSSPPVTLGRTLMYPATNNADFFGVLEMLPSDQTSSQYTSVEATPHLPKYMGGTCRFSASSTVANLALFGTSKDPNAVFVHQYQWDADRKVQAAWHRWTFPFEVATAYFAGDLMHIVFVQNGHMVLCVIDARAGAYTAEEATRPFLDLYSQVTIADHTVLVPEYLRLLDTNSPDYLRLVESSGALAGSLIGAVRDGTSLDTVLSHPAGDAFIGAPYTSLLSPSPPMHRDREGRAITTNKLTLQRYLVTTANSGEYKVAVKDATTPAGEDPLDVGVLFYSSSELELGETLRADNALAVIPCRTDAYTTTLALSTSGTGDLNVVALDYVLKANQKIRRR